MICDVCRDVKGINLENNVKKMNVYLAGTISKGRNKIPQLGRGLGLE